MIRTALMGFALALTVAAAPSLSARAEAIQSSAVQIAQAAYDSVQIRRQYSSSPSASSTSGFKMQYLSNRRCIGRMNNRLDLGACAVNSSKDADTAFLFQQSQGRIGVGTFCLTAENRGERAAAWPVDFKECFRGDEALQIWFFMDNGELVLSQPRGKDWLCLASDMTARKCDGRHRWRADGGTPAVLAWAELNPPPGFRIQATQARNVCFGVDGGAPARGRAVRLTACDGGQPLRFTHGPNGSLRVGDLCLDVSGENRNRGAQIILWSCHGRTNQSFQFGNGNLYARIAPNLCLDASRERLSPGTNIITWNCHGKANQKWREM